MIVVVLYHTVPHFFNRSYRLMVKFSLPMIHNIPSLVYESGCEQENYTAHWFLIINPRYHSNTIQT